MAKTIDQLLSMNLKELTSQNENLGNYFMAFMHQVSTFAKQRSCPIEKVRLEGLKQNEDGTFHMAIRYGR